MIYALKKFWIICIVYLTTFSLKKSIKKRVWMLLQKVLFCFSFFYNSASLNKKESFSFQHEYIEQGEVKRGIVMTTCVFCLILSSTTKKMPSNQCCLFIRLVLNKETSSCNNFFIAARTEHRITQHFRVRRLIKTPAYSLGRSGFIDC
jgi:hypothetical protein